MSVSFRSTPSSRYRARRPAVEKSVATVRPLDAEQQVLARENVRLAYMLASQFRRRCARDVPYDDLISEATYALVRAAMSFDPGRGVPFSAFATNGIKMYLIQFTRAWRNRYRFWHAISQCAEKDVGEITGHSSHKNRDVCDEVGDREACDQIRKRLPAQWWGVLSDYMQGDNQEEIALKRGVCRQRGHQLLKKAREMAFKSFEELAAVYCA